MPPSDAPVQQMRRPTLSSSCARAATAEEARFRLRYPRATQASRIVALDQEAAPIVCRLAGREWSGDARFLTYQARVGAEGNGLPVDAALRTCDGSETRLSSELDDAEIVVMVATADDAVEAASLIGDACAERRIMTTGLVLAEWGALDATVSSLRPNAMVMVVSMDEDELVGILTALRV
ncbi:MAG: 3-methyl-2-oxobutanoate hydroxymethyltransferase [Nitriliruptorales bacterium]|nr:3-methyl-2-oxobutanoate hydroxymethyltransferase [Nitriliruptorales bacterium]